MEEPSPSFIGVTGLVNLGNTCYMNTVLQCLFHTKPFVKLFVVGPMSEDEWIQSFYQLLQSMWKPRPTKTALIPRKFFDLFLAIVEDTNQFELLQQHDAQEFLMFLIDYFHTKTEKEHVFKEMGEPAQTEFQKRTLEAYASWRSHFSKHHSALLGIFYGQFCTLTETTNLQTQKKESSQTFDPFNMIGLEIDKSTTTLLDALNRWNQPEHILTETISITNQTWLWYLPQVLIFYLKRWTFDHQKNSTLVSFPIDELNLLPYHPGTKKQNASYYQCFAIINHIGNVNGGHYYAFIKHSQTNEWYEFNDLRVNSIEKDQLVTPYAYCLLYEKKI